MQATRVPREATVGADHAVTGHDDTQRVAPHSTAHRAHCTAVSYTHLDVYKRQVNNTPRQINIFKALGKEPPVYAHLPTVLNALGEKMSKRNGAKPVTQYREEGYLPDAMVNLSLIHI